MTSITSNKPERKTRRTELNQRRASGKPVSRVGPGKPRDTTFVGELFVTIFFVVFGDGLWLHDVYTSLTVDNDVCTGHDF